MTEPSGPPVVAVVGRPNVGKSTLVNRLAGAREAIVEERPGVTRDRTSHEAQWRGRTVSIVDSGGWTPGWGDLDDPLAAAVTAQAELAAEHADLVLFVVDATVGITDDDAAVAGWLRRGGARVVVVANKADTLGAPGALVAAVADLHALGLGDPVPVSALHGTGSGDLLDVVLDRLEADAAFDRPDPDEEGVPGVALIGRPNVGKSSLFNRLVGAERAIVDHRPGTTRDAVDTVVRLGDGRSYRFVDTAGLRRRARVRRGGDPTEYYSTVRTLRALSSAAVALLIVDVDDVIGEQEQKLARQVLDAGRGLVLVLNKWDRIDEESRRLREREQERLLHFLPDAPVVRTAATTGRGVSKLPDAIDAVIAEWRRRVPTSRLNDWLAEAVAEHPPPLVAGHTVRLRYATQVAVGPPTVRVFASGKVEDGYRRYLERSLRETFGFAGTPIDFGVRVRPRWEERGR
ncbi:MAG: ribosome biogenesis GTPase Der [Actinomycetota bacterium]